ncbi:hypothetical protein [Xylanimonas allomyrinae]|uniref:hypothetical protein n=1 Tax=Xylanimonas allomyrinae TaxID=2509459 RepID=UPI0013A61C8B|nr:hypothetical protein [Xylanimonas allomyrinae]
MDPQSYVTTWLAVEAQRAVEAEHRREAAARPEQRVRRRHGRLAVAVRRAR